MTKIDDLPRLRIHKPSEHEMKGVFAIAPVVLEMRTLMRTKGLSQARVICPWCKDHLVASIAKSNGHIHAACMGCKRSLMQ